MLWRSALVLALRRAATVLVLVIGTRFDDNEIRGCRRVEERLVFLEGIPVLEISDDVDPLAASLLAGVPLPEKASIDALHISVAAVNGVEYLLTWNCKHIANPSMRPKIERICREMGFEPPVICTPQELLEIDDEF